MPNNSTAQENRGAHGYWSNTGKLAGSSPEDHARYSAWISKIKDMKKGAKGAKGKAAGKDPANWRRNMAIKDALAKLRAGKGSGKGASGGKGGNSSKSMARNSTRARTSRNVGGHADPSSGGSWSQGRIVAPNRSQGRGK